MTTDVFISTFSSTNLVAAMNRLCSTYWWMLWKTKKRRSRIWAQKQKRLRRRQYPAAEAAQLRPEAGVTAARSSCRHDRATGPWCLATGRKGLWKRHRSQDRIYWNQSILRISQRNAIMYTNMCKSTTTPRNGLSIVWSSFVRLCFMFAYLWFCFFYWINN